MTPNDDAPYTLAASLQTGTTAIADLLLSKGASVSNSSVLGHAIGWDITLEYIEETLIQKHGARPLRHHAISALKKRRFDVLAMLPRKLKTATPPVTKEEMETYIRGSRLCRDLHLSFNECFFRFRDSGVRVIIPFIDWWNWRGGVEELVAFRGRTRYEFYTDPQVKGDFKAFIRAIVLPKKLFTDPMYQDDELVPGWEL
ncbi:hypothetical protein DFS34DRAFT_692470 [Phlyctochytrium arcticum]|nr:hypothetical protein DFS34DRAFT_692470 [Phlyctochytrium arcticum]